MADSDSATAQLREDDDCQISVIGWKSGLCFDWTEVDTAKNKIRAVTMECHNKHSDHGTDGSVR